MASLVGLSFLHTDSLSSLLLQSLGPLGECPRTRQKKAHGPPADAASHVATHRTTNLVAAPSSGVHSSCLTLSTTTAPKPTSLTPSSAAPVQVSPPGFPTGNSGNKYVSFWANTHQLQPQAIQDLQAPPSGPLSEMHLQRGPRVNSREPTSANDKPPPPQPGRKRSWSAAGTPELCALPPNPPLSEFLLHHLEPQEVAGILRRAAGLRPNVPRLLPQLQPHRQPLLQALPQYPHQGPHPGSEARFQAQTTPIPQRHLDFGLELLPRHERRQVLLQLAEILLRIHRCQQQEQAREEHMGKRARANILEDGVAPHPRVGRHVPSGPHFSDSAERFPESSSIPPQLLRLRMAHMSQHKHPLFGSRQQPENEHAQLGGGEAGRGDVPVLPGTSPTLRLSDHQFLRASNAIFRAVERHRKRNMCHKTSGPDCFEQCAEIELQRLRRLQNRMWDMECIVSSGQGLAAVENVEATSARHHAASRCSAPAGKRVKVLT